MSLFPPVGLTCSDEWPMAAGERGRQAGSHVSCILTVYFISSAAGLPGSPGAPGPQGPPGPSGRCNPEDCLYPMTSAQQKAGGKWTLQRKTRSWWDGRAIRAVDPCFTATCCQGLWFLDRFSLPSESYPDSNWKSVFSDVSQLRSVCVCFTMAMSSIQFHMKMQASLSRVLQKKSHEVIWATDDIWFVNSSTWIDFDFWTWIFEVYIDIFFIFKFTIVAWKSSFCSSEIETAYYCCWLSYDWFFMRSLTPFYIHSIYTEK